MKAAVIFLTILIAFSSICAYAAPFSDIWETGNINPTIDLNIAPAKKPIDIVIMTDYTGVKLASLNTQINALKAQLNAVNIDPALYIISDVKKIGSQDDELYIFRRYARYRYMYDEYTYSSSTDYHKYYNEWVEVPALWEETQGLLSQYNSLPKRNPTNVSFARTGPFSYKSPSGNLETTYYQVALSCSNDVKTYYFISELLKTWSSSVYYGFKNIIDECLTIDKSWVLGPKVSDVTYDIYSLNFDKLSSLPLRSGSDRHMLFISDNLQKDYSQSFGSYFSFGGLTESVSKYIKDNNFSLYGVMPEKLIDLTFADDKVADIFAIGETTLFRMENGEVRRLGSFTYKGEGASGEKCYPETTTDVSTPAQIISYPGYSEDYTYYLMDGTIKYYDSWNSRFVAVSGMPAIRQIYREGLASQCYILSTEGFVYRFALDTRSIVLLRQGSQPAFDKIASYNYKPVFLTSSGEAYVLSDEYINGSWKAGYYKRLKIRTYDSNGNFVERDMPAVKDLVSFTATKGSSLSGILVLYSNGTIQQFTSFGSEYIQQTKNYKYYKEYITEDTAYSILEANVSSILYNGVNVLIFKNDGTVRVLRPEWIERTSGGKTYYTAVYSRSTIGTPLTNIASTFRSIFNKHFFKGSNGHTYMYTFTNAAEDPVFGSNLIDMGTEVKKIVEDYKNKTLYILFNDGTIREITFTFNNYYIEDTNTYPAYENVKNLYVSDLNMYVLYNDGTVKGKGFTDCGQLGFVSSNKVTALTDPFATALTYNKSLYEYSVRSAFNDSTGGIFYPSGDYATAFNDIYNKYTGYSTSGNMNILLGETVTYSSAYDDYEDDPEYTRKWSITHDPYYFDNSMGLSAYHNPAGFSSAPPMVLDKVGKYTINLYARDNPKNDNRFDAYRLWSLANANLTVYVHRKPVALMKINLTNNGNGTFTVVASDAGSYDLDHCNSRADRGITAREWRWKEATSNVWTSGVMNKADCDPGKGYIIQLRVKDVEGVWSDYATINIDRNNPPVALFSLDTNVININDVLKAKDQSFPQSFSTITRWHWAVKKLNGDGSVQAGYLQNGQFANSNAGTSALSGYDTNVKTSYTENGAGVYRIYLRVKDSNGLWSDGGSDSTTPTDLSKYYHMDFAVDEAPTPCFTVANSVIGTTDTLRITDTTTATGTSAVARWHWIVKKLNADGSTPTTDLQNEIFATHNGGSGELEGCDINVKTNYSAYGTGIYRIYLRAMNGNGMWSDGGTAEAYELSRFYYRDIVVDSAPVASFTIEKNPIEPAELLKLKDRSVKTGVSPIVKWHWIVKKLNTDGSEPVTSLQDEQFADSNKGMDSLAGYDSGVKTDYSKDGPGTYRIYLRVRNGSGMWSDGGTDGRADLGKCFHSDLLVKEAFKLANFRVVKVKDLHLSSFYYNPATGQYDDKPMGVNTMAVDPVNFNDLVDGLTKGYIFEFEIDTVNFNDDNDTIEIVPRFYTCDNSRRDPEERDLYWEDSRHQILKAGEGGHSEWAKVLLRRENRVINGENNATWRGSYLIPGTAWAVPEGISADIAAASRLDRDIIVNFEIKGYKNGVMKFDYNLKQWPSERSVNKYPYEIGDVIRYSYKRNNLDDIGVILNRP